MRTIKAYLAWLLVLVALFILYNLIHQCWKPISKEYSASPLSLITGAVYATILAGCIVKRAYFWTRKQIRKRQIIR